METERIEGEQQRGCYNSPGERQQDLVQDSGRGDVFTDTAVSKMGQCGLGDDSVDELVYLLIQ